jgi:hypothetical protein
MIIVVAALTVLRYRESVHLAPLGNLALIALAVFSS